LVQNRQGKNAGNASKTLKEAIWRHFWHDLHGEILAIGHPIGSHKCVPVSGQAQSVLEVEIEEKQITSLHHTHIVDVLQQRLIKHPSAKQTAD
jgi:hypothetical protein